MKTTNVKFLVVLLISLFSVKASAHNIAVRNADGVTIYYNYINNNTELAVSYQGSSCYAYSIEYSGNVVIPESVTYNGKTYSVTSIGESAFEDCIGLTSVTIPNSVTSIGEGAFYNCSGLTRVTIPNSVTSIGSEAFYGCSGLTSVAIPNSVTSIGYSAFYRCSGLTSITIPNSVTSIGSSAFYGTAWYNNQPDGLVYAGKVAYRYKGTMPSNTSIVIEEGTLGIGGSAFSDYRGLTSVTIPNSVTSIGNSAFSGCSGLTSVTIPNSVTIIGDYAFDGCSGLTSITIPNSVTSIGERAFWGCSGLTNVTIPNSVTSIGWATFRNCSGLTSVTIPNSVTSIGDDAFLGCSGLTSVTIPNSVTSIGSYAFSGCSGLTSVTIPNSVTSIGEYAFRGCNNMKTVYSEIESPFAINENVFTTQTYAGTLHVPAGTATKYQQAEGWKKFTNIVEVQIVENITFADATVKAICVANWDTNGDGELSKDEAAAVTDLGTRFSNNTNITSFDELQYFVGLTQINENAFYYCSGLTSITIPNSVTSIGGSVFSGCSGLTAVNVESGNIKYDSRENCNAIIETETNTLVTGCQNTIIPNSVKSIGNEAFSGCSGLTSVTIPNSVTSIRSYAFYYCSGLTSITIPNSVTSIGGSVFSGCSGLTAVNVESGNIKYDSRENCNAIIETETNTLVTGCQNTIIPNSVTSIGIDAFFGCIGLTSITIPNSVTSIGDYAFEGCSGLTSVTIGNSVTSIGEWAFAFCSGLTSVTIPNSVTSIGGNAFAKCDNLKTVYSEIESPFAINENVFSEQTYAGTLHVPAGTKVKYQQAGGWKKFTNIVEVQIVENITFADANVKAICVANWDTNGDGELSKDEAAAVTNLGTRFSNNTNITSFDELQYFVGLTQINENAFYDCSGLTSVTIPNSVTSIRQGAFRNCSGLTSVTIPNSVTSIGIDAFFGCIGLTSVTIPNSVTSIGSGAFYGCSGLTSVTIPNSVTSIEDDAFYGCSGLTSVTIPNSVTSIGILAFRGCSGLTSITIPNSVTSIGDYAFRDCSGLTSVTISNSVTSIGNYAFCDCSSLTSVTIPNSVTSIGGSAFSGCYGLTSITIPNSVTSIGSGAFGGCSGLTSVTIPNSVTSIGYGAFYGCSGLTSVTIPNSVTSIEEKTFYNCSGLTSVTIPNSVTSIGTLAFYGCSGLTSVTIPNSVTSIGSGAFHGCNNLKTVYSEIVSPFAINENVFSEQTYAGTLHVPANTKSKYLQANGWKKFKNIVDPMQEEQTTFTLSIIATGNGSAAYNGTTVRGTTRTFEVTEGTTASITFTPDDGYRIKTVKVNGGTVSVTNNQYTIGSINANTTISVEFEEIPPTIYTLSITATGNGYAAYDGTTVRGTTRTFEVTEGTTATITFTPDGGYRIKTVKVNGGTVSVTNNQYTVSSISANTTISVEFEEIPPTIYTLSITATGNGSAAYDGTTVRGTTRTFEVTEGTTAIITFTPDGGYRIKTVKVNGVTVSVTNNQYTVSSISANTTISVEFEEIPPTIYTLSITATGNGSAAYDGTTVRGTTSSFDVTEGTTASITFTPDGGYRIKSVKVNGVTVSVTNNQYTVSSISANTTISVEFEEIPPTIYTLSITATGNGSAAYNGTTVRGTTRTFDVTDGTTATITFTPDNGYRIKTVKVNGATVSLANNQYTISSINANTTVEVTFVEIPSGFTGNDLNYSVTSYSERQVKVIGGNYGNVLTVPATVTYEDETWKVVGIVSGTLANNSQLAAVIWEPEAAFTESVSNPNLLLYVKSAGYAPASIRNVVVNGTANNIILTDATNGNDFYCPQEFTARKISYTHNYSMATGIGESKGWESIALPFDVAKTTHASKGEMVPYQKWDGTDSKKPYWLMELGAGGFVNANAIKANTPYIISMPNHSNYREDYRLNGSITFSAENVRVKRTDDLSQASSGDKTFVPNFANRQGTGIYALNVNSDYVTYTGGLAAGSRFVPNLRTLHPFEAYMTSTATTRMPIVIGDNMATAIAEVPAMIDERAVIRVYLPSGQLVVAEKDKSLDEVKAQLPAGVYIVNGQKLIIK